MGDSQLGHAGVTCSRSSDGVPAASPMPRSRYAARTNATEMLFAPRDVRNSWAANRPKARNAKPETVIAAPPDERSGRVEAVRDQRECDEQAERDVGEHAVHHGRGRRQDPSRRGRGDRLGAALLLLLTGVAHGEERAHQAAHEGEPGEEQEERERAVVDAVRRAAEDEDRSGRDRDAEDLAPVLLLAVGVEHRARWRRTRAARCRRSTARAAAGRGGCAAGAARGAWSRPRLLLRPGRARRRSGAGRGPRATAARRSGPARRGERARAARRPRGRCRP